MERTLTYIITEKENGMLIGHFLRSKGYSAQVIIALKKQPESILLNGGQLVLHNLEY